MAIYRNVNITFWTDTKVADDFTPEDKYFMLYCLTNSYTNLCGCYEISIKQMAIDTGYNKETIEKLLERFKNIHKVILYDNDNKELLIKNWSKYNWTKSSKLDKPLLKEIKEIKTMEFRKYVADEYNKRDTVSIPYIYPIDTTVTVTVSDTVSVTDTVSDSDSDIKKQTAVDFYQQNINYMTPFEFQKLQDYKDMDEELIILAMQKAILSNKRNFNYIDGILKNWKAKGIRTVIQAKQEEQEFKNKNKPKQETDKEEMQRKINELKGGFWD